MHVYILSDAAIITDSLWAISFGERESEANLEARQNTFRYSLDNLEISDYVCKITSRATKCIHASI